MRLLTLALLASCAFAQDGFFVETTTTPTIVISEPEWKGTSGIGVQVASFNPTTGEIVIAEGVTVERLAKVMFGILWVNIEAQKTCMSPGTPIRTPIRKDTKK